MQRKEYKGIKRKRRSRRKKRTVKIEGEGLEQDQRTGIKGKELRKGKREERRKGRQRYK